MENNSVSLNSVILNLNKNSAGELSFNAGEVLRGEVKEILSNNMVSIFLQGKLIAALTEVKVNPGQKLFLMVEGQKEGKTYLKVIIPEMMDEIENSNIARTLVDVGLPIKSDKMDIVRNLMKFQMPVNKENILSMEKNISILGDNSSNNLNVAAFCLNKGISKPDEIRNLGTFINQGNISSAVIGLDKVLQSIVSELPDNFPLIADYEKVVAVKLSQSRTEELIQPSNRQLEIQALASNSDTKNNDIFMGEKPIYKSLEGVHNILQLLRDVLVLEKMSDTSAIKQQLFNRIKFDGVETQIFDIVKKFAQDEELIQRFPMIRQISEQLKTLEQELNGQRLFNINNKENLTEMNQIHISFPVKYEEGYRLCQLKIKKNSSGKQQNQADQMRIVVALDTEKMGVVLFDVDWNKNKQLKIRGIVETQAVCSFVAQNMDSLIKRLNVTGYQVHNLGVKVSEDGELSDHVKPDLIGVTSTLDLFKNFRIDIKI